MSAYFVTDWDHRMSKQTTESLLGDLMQSYKKQLTPGVIAERARLKNEIMRRWQTENQAQAVTA